jgi:hypothetical protein
VTDSMTVVWVVMWMVEGDTGSCMTKQNTRSVQELTTHPLMFTQDAISCDKPDWRVIRSCRGSNSCFDRLGQRSFELFLTGGVKISILFVRPHRRPSRPISNMFDLGINPMNATPLVKIKFLHQIHTAKPLLT